MASLIRAAIVAPDAATKTRPSRPMPRSTSTTVVASVFDPTRRARVANADDVAADVRRQEVVEERRDEERVGQRAERHRHVLRVEQQAPAPGADAGSSTKYSAERAAPATAATRPRTCCQSRAEVDAATAARYSSPPLTTILRVQMQRPRARDASVVAVEIGQRASDRPIERRSVPCSVRDTARALGPPRMHILMIAPGAVLRAPGHPVLRISSHPRADDARSHRRSGDVSVRPRRRRCRGCASSAACGRRSSRTSRSGRRGPRCRSISRSSLTALPAAR